MKLGFEFRSGSWLLYKVSSPISFTVGVLTLIINYIMNMSCNVLYLWSVALSDMVLHKQMLNSV